MRHLADGGLEVVEVIEDDAARAGGDALAVQQHRLALLLGALHRKSGLDCRV